VESSIKKIKVVDLLITFIAITLILLGLLINKIIILLGISIIAINVALKEINTIYSILVSLIVFHSTHLTNDLPFEWSLLYYVSSILIIGLVVLKEMSGEKFKTLFKDKYLYLMLMILAWGLLSAVFSTNQIQSFKNILSTFLVFTIFYIVPKYFYSKRELLNWIKYIAVPLNLLTSAISLTNILVYLELFTIKTNLFEWNINSAIYRNSNGYGANIMLTLIATNLLFMLDKEFTSRSNKVIIRKVLMLNYPILIINLLVSGSRAALLGTIIAFIPLALKKKKQAIAVGVIGVVFLLTSAENLLLFRKLEKATTSGRWEMWLYGINNVIAKHPILGIGAGASNDHIGIFEGKSIHNSYLNLIMSLGVVGFLLWMLILALVFYSSFKNKKNKYLFIFTILGIMAFAFFETSLFGGMGRTMAIFWMIVMLIEKELKYYQ